MPPELRVIEGERGRPERAWLSDLHARCGGQVHARCLWLLGDRAEAEDATQEVFAKAFVHRAELLDVQATLGWLLRIATNHCLNLLRANRALWREEVRRVAELSPRAGSAPDQLALVRSLLGRFDEETQACAVHYLVDEMSQEEVAALVGLSVPTVRKRVRTFLREARLALGLTPDGEELP